MKVGVERIEEMVTRKTVPSRRRKPAKKAAKAAKSSDASRGVSKKNEGRGGSPAGGTQNESSILDGTRLDVAVRDEETDDRPWVEILVDNHTRVVVGMKVAAREVADEL
jgi:hypothetical protein